MDIDRIAARIVASEAERKYAERRKVVNRHIADLKKKLENLDKDFENHPGDWGYVGSLAHAQELLEELNNFLQ